MPPISCVTWVSGDVVIQTEIIKDRKQRKREMQKQGKVNVYGGSWRRDAESESNEQKRQLQGL